jgi:hypothetical protein
MKPDPDWYRYWKQKSGRTTNLGGGDRREANRRSRGGVAQVPGVGCAPPTAHCAPPTAAAFASTHSVLLVNARLYVCLYTTKRTAY